MGALPTHAARNSRLLCTGEETSVSFYRSSMDHSFVPQHPGADAAPTGKAVRSLSVNADWL
ncbi:MAG TPA: hypothetical protein PLV86_05745 [Candidatus Fermentibacter daniensis]|nr:hypothetical protein [Candidatus Fermentibacter daniensis]